MADPYSVADGSLNNYDDELDNELRAHLRGCAVAATGTVKRETTLPVSGILGGGHQAVAIIGVRIQELVSGALVVQLQENHSPKRPRRNEPPIAIHVSRTGQVLSGTSDYVVSFLRQVIRLRAD